MTLETRNTVELSDITSLEYECRKCMAKSVRLLDEHHSIPALCGNCGNMWIVDGSQEHNDLIRFVNMMRNFPKSTANAHVRIKLEVRGIEGRPIASGRASGGKD